MFSISNRSDDNSNINFTKFRNRYAVCHRIVNIKHTCVIWLTLLLPPHHHHHHHHHQHHLHRYHHIEMFKIIKYLSKLNEQIHTITTTLFVFFCMQKFSPHSRLCIWWSISCTIHGSLIANRGCFQILTLQQQNDFFTGNFFLREMKYRYTLVHTFAHAHAHTHSHVKCTEEKRTKFEN